MYSRRSTIEEALGKTPLRQNAPWRHHPRQDHRGGQINVMMRRWLAVGKIVVAIYELRRPCLAPASIRSFVARSPLRRVATVRLALCSRVEGWLPSWNATKMPLRDVAGCCLRPGGRRRSLTPPSHIASSSVMAVQKRLYLRCLVAAARLLPHLPYMETGPRPNVTTMFFSNKPTPPTRPYLPFLPSSLQSGPSLTYIIHRRSARAVSEVNRHASA